VNEETISAARLSICMEEFPYLTSILYNLTPVATPGLGTMAVDKWWRLYYDPELDWDIPTTAAVLYHEVGHIMRDHQARGETYNHKIFNIAGDAEINDDIRAEAKWQLPEWVVYPEKFGAEEGKLAEYYYKFLVDNAKECDGNCDGGGIHLPGEGDGEGNCQSSTGTPMNGKDCGSIADGTKRDYEKGGDGEKKISHAEGDMIRKQVADDINQHIATKGIGSVPAWMERWVEGFLNPTVPWQDEFRAEFNSFASHVAGNMDYSYRKPGRRSSAIPQIVLPTMTSPEVNVAAVVDTSGSMGQEELVSCLAELEGIIKASGSKVGVSVYACDADVASAQKVFSANQVNLAGGGGTDMRVGIEEAQNGRPRPDIIVVLTDGYTPWPEEEIKEKLIIGIVGNSDTSSCPEWARTIVIEDEVA